MFKYLIALLLSLPISAYAEDQTSSSCEVDSIEKTFHITVFNAPENYTFLNKIDIGTETALKRIKTKNIPLYKELKKIYEYNYQFSHNKTFTKWLNNEKLINDIKIIIAPTSLDDYILFYLANTPTEETVNTLSFLKTKYHLFDVTNESIYRFAKLNQAFYSSNNKTIYIGIDSHVIKQVENNIKDFKHTKEQINQLASNFTLAHELGHHLLNQNQFTKNNNEPFADAIAFLLLNKYYQYNTTYYNDSIKLIHFLRINTKNYQPTFEVINIVNNNPKLFNKDLPISQQILNLKKLTRN